MLIEKELLKKVEEITFTDYEPYKTKDENIVLIDLMGVKAIIEDLINNYHILEEEKEDMKDYYETHYQYVAEPEPIPDCER